jgi:hypothetical protein
MPIDSVTAVQYSGYFQKDILKSLEQGKVAPEAEEDRIQKRLEEERKRVQPIYNSQGKLIEYDNSGRHLNIKA